jgi:hypothetical protein
MAWTYNVSLINATPLYQVRLLCGDTDITDQLLQDEEINYLLSVFSTYEAAAQACDAIAAKFSRQADQTTGDISTSYSQRAKMYSERAIQLRNQSQNHTAAPYAGGISVSDKMINEQDTDVVQPSFTRGLDFKS